MLYQGAPAATEVALPAAGARRLAARLARVPILAHAGRALRRGLPGTRCGRGRFRCAWA